MNTHTYVLVVVQHEGRFVLVQEAREGNPWYVPAGRVEPLESLKHAALRALGPQTTAIGASSTIWAFFAAHPLP